MEQHIDPDLREAALQWSLLPRRRRRQLAIDLRTSGLSYGEILALIPIPKSTLALWCAGIGLTPQQVEAIHTRSGVRSRHGASVDTQWRRRAEIEEIRRQAREFAIDRINDPWFVLGVTLYWGEGAKSRNYLDLVNGDPRALKAFATWVREYLDQDARFVLSLHLHQGDDEAAAKEFWRSALDMPDVEFTKTMVKPPGTGYRKNELLHGVCRVRTRNAADHWNRMMVWIDVVASHYGALPSRHC